MRWIKYKSEEETKELVKFRRSGIEPDERLPIPRRMSHEESVCMDFSDDEDESEVDEQEDEMNIEDECTT